MHVGSTFGPIPIRGCPFVAALLDERIFEVLDKISVPREEQPREMDLFVGLEVVKAQRTPSLHQR